MIRSITFLLVYSENSSWKEKCDVVENSAYGVTVQGSAGDRLEPDYIQHGEQPTV